MLIFLIQYFYFPLLCHRPTHCLKLRSPCFNALSSYWQHPHFQHHDFQVFASLLKFQPCDFQVSTSRLSKFASLLKFQPCNFQVSTSRLSSFNLATFKFETEEIDLSQTYTPTQIQTTHKHTHTLKNSFSITHNTTQIVRKLSCINTNITLHTT